MLNFCIVIFAAFSRSLNHWLQKVKLIHSKFVCLWKTFKRYLS